MSAAWAEPARPERIPHSPALRIARPAIQGARAPRTFRTMDLGFALHDDVVMSLRVCVEGSEHSMQIGNALPRIFGMASIAIDEKGPHANGRTSFDVPA